ncbi:MAG: hypothetical protein KJP21_00785 [Bacteroidia bacterium]|nr:hypothetical protein [Bacteroidia bacterium]
MSFLSSWLMTATMIGGIAFTIVFGMFLFSFESQDYAEDGGSNTDMIKGILAILSLFAFAYFLISYEVEFEGKQLKAHGIVTTAKIIDKTALRAKRSETHSAEVAFEDQLKKVVHSKVLLSKDEYRNVTIGQAVSIVYVPEYTDIVRILFSKEQYQRLKGELE